MREVGSKFQNLHFFSTEYVLIMKQQEKEVLATSPWSTHWPKPRLHVRAEGCKLLGRHRGLLKRPRSGLPAAVLFLCLYCMFLLFHLFP